jgi:hypothetical protein
MMSDTVDEESRAQLLAVEDKLNKIVGVTDASLQLLPETWMRSRPCPTTRTTAFLAYSVACPTKSTPSDDDAATNNHIGRRRFLLI